MRKISRPSLIIFALIRIWFRLDVLGTGGGIEMCSCCCVIITRLIRDDTFDCVHNETRLTFSDHRSRVCVITEKQKRHLNAVRHTNTQTHTHVRTSIKQHQSINMRKTAFTEWEREINVKAHMKESSFWIKSVSCDDKFIWTFVIAVQMFCSL